MKLQRVISGGQIGADIAGLRAAKSAGLETGGWIPRHFRTKDGPHPEYTQLYGLEECRSGGYPTRTRLNIENSDATVRFAYDFHSPGEVLTRKVCLLLNRPHFDVLLERPPGEQRGIAWLASPDWETFVDWLHYSEIRVLNVAGNADPSIEPVVTDYLIHAFMALQGRPL